MNKPVLDGIDADVAISCQRALISPHDDFWTTNSCCEMGLDAASKGFEARGMVIADVMVEIGVLTFVKMLALIMRTGMRTFAGYVL